MRDDIKILDVPVGAGTIDIAANERARQQYEAEKRNSLPHYGYFALGVPPKGHLDLGDRNLGIPVWYRGRLMRLHNFMQEVPNMSDEALEKENDEDQPATIVDKRYAAALADEMEGACYGERGLKIIKALIGVPNDIKDQIELAIMPKVPPTLIGIMRELEDNALARIEEQIDDPATQRIARLALTEMIQAAETSFNWATAYIDASEGERVQRAASNGTGKARIDQADRYYYKQLEREPLNLTLQGTPITGQVSQQQPIINVTMPKELVGQVQGQSTDMVVDKRPRVPCPACDEMIIATARICRYCHTDVNQYRRAVAEEEAKLAAQKRRVQAETLDVEQASSKHSLKPIEDRGAIDLDINPEILGQIEEAEERYQRNEEANPKKKK